MKIAIVTGASSGMGREFTKQLPYFYRRLDEIWVIARRKDRLLSLAEECVLPVRIFEGDLLEDGVYQSVKDALEKETPNVRMLVNAAGFGKMGLVTEIAKKEPDSQTEMIDLNCCGLTKFTILCLPYFKRGSRVVNVASAASFCPQPTFTVYAATKAYVLSFSRALGAELKKRGIYITAVCPGPVDTEFFSISGKLPNIWKDAVMANPAQVVRKALKDARKRKSISIYGFAMKAAYVGAKLVPHELIIRLETGRKD